MIDQLTTFPMNNQMTTFLLITTVSAFGASLFAEIPFKFLLYVGCVIAYIPYYDKSFRILCFVSMCLVYLMSLVAIVVVPLMCGAIVMAMWTLIHIIIFEAHGPLFILLHWLMFHVDVKLVQAIPPLVIDWMNDVECCFIDLPVGY
jgi:hypothetical protein